MTEDAPKRRTIDRFGNFAPIFAKFMLLGIPAFAVAISLNWMLVQVLKCPAPAAYALVLVIQMTTNFLLCRRFVFGEVDPTDFWRQYSTFMLGNLAIRSTDWALYSGVVAFRPNWFLAVQFANVILFSVVKFVFARHVFLKKSRAP